MSHQALNLPKIIQKLAELRLEISLLSSELKAANPYKKSQGLAVTTKFSTTQEEQAFLKMMTSFSYHLVHHPLSLSLNHWNQDSADLPSTIARHAATSTTLNRTLSTRWLNGHHRKQHRGQSHGESQSATIHAGVFR